MVFPEEVSLVRGIDDDDTALSYGGGRELVDSRARSGLGVDGPVPGPATLESIVPGGFSHFL